MRELVGDDALTPMSFGREGTLSDPGAGNGTFKTPTLREVARSAPYMHDGSMATLADVVAYYDRGANALESFLRVAGSGDIVQIFSTQQPRFETRAAVCTLFSYLPHRSVKRCWQC